MFDFRILKEVSRNPKDLIFSFSKEYPELVPLYFHSSFAQDYFELDAVCLYLHFDELRDMELIGEIESKANLISISDHFDNSSL